MSLPSQWFLKRRGLATGQFSKGTSCLLLPPEPDHFSHTHLRYRHKWRWNLWRNVIHLRPPAHCAARTKVHPAHLFLHTWSCLHHCILSDRGTTSSAETEGQRQDRSTLAASSELLFHISSTPSSKLAHFTSSLSLSFPTGSLGPSYLVLLHRERLRLGFRVHNTVCPQHPFCSVRQERKKLTSQRTRRYFFVTSYTRHAVPELANSSTLKVSGPLFVMNFVGGIGRVRPRF